MIGLIVARSKNNVIGKNGNIPWKIKGEQKQFRELTTGNVVIMGRKSYEEIGHPLPNRMNIVVSTTTEYQGDNLVSVKSLEDALLLAKGRDVYISGGYGLFKEALQIVDKMYITEVDLNIEDGDTFFPEFDINDFEVLIGETLGEEVKYRKSHFGNAAFPPPASHGSIGRGYSSSLHLYLPYLLSDVSVGLFFIHNIPKH